MKCHKCLQSFNKPQTIWDGFCPICEERIGILMYQFIIYNHNDGMLNPSPIYQIYIDYSYYNEKKVQPHKINEYQCTDGVTYISDNYASMVAFRYGWLACQDYVLDKMYCRPQRINLEGITQWN